MWWKFKSFKLLKLSRDELIQSEAKTANRRVQTFGKIIEFAKFSGLLSESSPKAQIRSGT